MAADGENAGRPVAGEGDAAGAPGRMILRPGRNVWKTATPERAGLVVDARDYYRTFYFAAREARHSILMSGWQFDSGLELVRGEDVPGGGSGGASGGASEGDEPAEVRFLQFLNGLCETKPELRVYILAWDFHIVLAAEREWMQRLLFGWMTNERFQFLFDDCPVAGGSHHQKFVVIDGVLAFVGGMDVCESRWDDRRHRGENPLRVSRGRPQKPYHDVQAWLEGRAVAAVVEDLFVERWMRAGGERPVFEGPADSAAHLPIERTLELGASPVAFSRTDPCPNDAESAREVEALFVDAVEAAEELIYIETQYFSSRRVHDALVSRMQSAGRRKLEIVILVNERAEALKEELAVGLRQAKNLLSLREVAEQMGHALGLYYTICDGPTEKFRNTYLHSKVMLVDDRFLTVGSANLTNRSMGVDSELHVSWEAAPERERDRRLVRAIRRVRVSLLAEHAGLSGVRAIRKLVPIEGLVARLEALAAEPGARLQPHGPPSPAQEIAMEIVDPEALPFDPESASAGDVEVSEATAEAASDAVAEADEHGFDEPSEQGPRDAVGRIAEAIGSIREWLK